MLTVLWQIFGHLAPLDILRLARTTKELRDVLMRRSVRSVWKLSFEGIDFPPCPDDLTEPQYAHLAFDNHCHVSLRFDITLAALFTLELCDIVLFCTGSDNSLGLSCAMLQGMYVHKVPLHPPTWSTYPDTL